MKLCQNCLDETTERPTDVGPDLGTQRDPYRLTVLLCGECSAALADGRFDILHNRYRPSRTISRGTERAS